jgi:predicted molibdopterin-dependent oxidoreductase YjgC
LKKTESGYEETQLQDVYSDLSKIIKDRGNKITFLLGSNLTNEEFTSFNEFSNKLGNNNDSIYLNEDIFFKGFFNEDIENAKIEDLNKSDTIIIWAEDLKETLPVLYLRVRQAVKNGVKLVVFGHTNSTLLDISDVYFGGETVSNNFEIIKDISELKQIKKYIKDKNVTAILGKSSPNQSDQSIEKLFTYLKDNSNLKLLNAFNGGNSFGAFQTLGSIKGNKEFSSQISNETTDLLFVVGADPIGKSIFSSEIKNIIDEIPTVVSLDLFMHETSEIADYIVPTSSTLGEKEGTFTNIEFRTSRIDKLIPSPGQALTDWEFITGLSNFCEFEDMSESLSGLNKKSFVNFDIDSAPTFDNLDKPRNQDGMINTVVPNITTTDEIIEFSDSFLVSKKLYGDKVTERHSKSISLLGSSQFIEGSESTFEKYKLNSGKCVLVQENIEITVNYKINPSLPDGLIFFPKNRRNMNKLDFTKKIQILPSHSMEVLNVN